MVKDSPAKQESDHQGSDWVDQSETAMHSSIFAWEIPLSMAGYRPWGLKRVGQDLTTKQ